MENSKAPTVSQSYVESFSMKTDSNCFEMENPTENA